MSYHHQIPHEMQRDVAREIAAFELPNDWRDGRTFLRGIAIDPADTIEIDDAMYIHPTQEGGQLVTVSIADVGSFMPKFPALGAIARDRVKHSATDKGSRVPVWPDKIVRKTLSLTPKEHRPVLTMRIPVSAEGEIGEASFMRGMLRAKQYSVENVQNMLQQPPERDGPQTTTLRGLARVAQLWRESGSGAFSADSLSSKDVVNGIIALSANKAAKYAVQHAIPGLYRTGSQSVRFSAEPNNDVLNLRITSPLRRYVDYLNQANIIAHITEEPYPFPEENVRAFVQEYARNRLQRVSDPAKISELFEKVEDGGIGACTEAFLHPSPSSEGSRLRKAARDKIVDRPEIARYFVNILIAKGFLRREGGYFREGKLRGNTYLVDSAGNTYTDVAPGRKLPANRRAQQQKDDIQTIVNVAALVEQQTLEQYPDIQC